MAVVGEWWRGIARASVVALLLPAAIVLGIVLTATLGGGDRLRAIGQVFKGPTAPVAGRGAADLVAAEHVPPVRIAHALAAAPRPGTVAGGGGRGSAPQRGGAGTPRRSQAGSPAGPGSSTTSPPAATTPSAPSRPSGGGSSSSGGGGSSPPPSNPVRTAGEQVVAVAQQVPVAGPVAGDTVQTVVDLVAPPPPPGAVPAALP